MLRPIDRCTDGMSVKNLGVFANGMGFAVDMEAVMYTEKQYSVQSNSNAAAWCNLGKPAVSKKKYAYDMTAQRNQHAERHAEHSAQRAA